MSKSQPILVLTFRRYAGIHGIQLIAELTNTFRESPALVLYKHLQRASSRRSSSTPKRAHCYTCRKSYELSQLRRIIHLVRMCTATLPSTNRPVRMCTAEVYSSSHPARIYTAEVSRMNRSARTCPAEESSITHAARILTAESSSVTYLARIHTAERSSVTHLDRTHIHC